MPSIFDAFESPKPQHGAAFLRHVGRDSHEPRPSDAVHASELSGTAASCPAAVEITQPVKRRATQGVQESYWHVRGDPTWQEMVRAVSGDGRTVQTGDGGQLAHGGDQDIHLPVASTQAIVIAAIEAAKRGMSPLQIEATSEKLANTIKAVLESYGIEVAGVEITSNPGARRIERPQDAQDSGEPADAHSNTADTAAGAGYSAASGAADSRFTVGVQRDVSQSQFTSRDGFTVIEGHQTCWCCKDETPVFAIELKDAPMTSEDGAPEEHVSGMLQFIKEINPEAVDALCTAGARMEKRQTQAGGEYFANACVNCNATQGDHFLYAPEGGFGARATKLAVHEIAGVPLCVNAAIFREVPAGEVLLSDMDMALKAPRAPGM